MFTMLHTCMHAHFHALTHAHIHSSTSFLLVAIIIEFITVLLMSYLRPFVQPSLDRLNMRTLVITCLVLFYGYPALQSSP